MRWASLLISVLAACGDGNDGAGHLDIEGKSGDEAARLLATRLCEREVRCGQASIECSSGGPAGGSPTTTRCMGQITPVTAAECFDDVFNDLSDVLGCKPITGAEATILRACFEPQIGRACVTQAELDAAVQRAQAGQSSNLNSRPPACDQLLTDFAGRCP